MELDAEQMNKLTIDAVKGRPPSIPGDAAKAFYNRVAKEVAAQKRRG